MLDSISPQLGDDDYITILWDSDPFLLFNNGPSTIVQIVNHEPLGFWGHASRNKWQKYYFGDFIMNADDDDIYVPDAMEKIRSCVKENKLYLFKMTFGETTFWRTQNIEIANIGTPCGVYPNRIPVPEWGLRYGGDFDFYDRFSKTIDVEFCDHVIYNIKP